MMEKIDDEVYGFIYDEPIYQLNKQKQSVEETPYTPKVEVATPISNTESTNTSPSISLINEASNFKGVIMFLNPKDSFDDADKAFLSAILKAVNLDLTNIHIIAANHQEIYSQARKKYKAKKYFLLNVNPFELGIKDKNLNKYELTNYDRAFWIHADSLKQIASDVNKKRGLWEGLKRMFF